MVRATRARRGPADVRLRAHRRVPVEGVAAGQWLGLDDVERGHAPPVPSSRARRSASWSIEGAPGDVDQVDAGLHGGERGRSSRRWRVAAVAGAATTTWSERPSSVARSGSTEHSFEGGDPPCAGTASHLHVEGQGPTGDLGADGPEADEPEGAPLEAPSWAVFQGSRGAADPRLGELLLEGQHGGQDELGDGRAAAPPASR